MKAHLGIEAPDRIQYFLYLFGPRKKGVKVSFPGTKAHETEADAERGAIDPDKITASQSGNFPETLELQFSAFLHSDAKDQT